MAEHPKADPVVPAMEARLACGCRVGFRAGVDGSPVTVVLTAKAEGCGLALHVAGLPIYDRREALRPATRVGPMPERDYEEG